MHPTRLTYPTVVIVAVLKTFQHNYVSLGHSCVLLLVSERGAETALGPADYCVPLYIPHGAIPRISRSVDTHITEDIYLPACLTVAPVQVGASWLADAGMFLHHANLCREVTSRTSHLHDLGPFYHCYFS